MAGGGREREREKGRGKEGRVKEVRRIVVGDRSEIDITKFRNKHRPQTQSTHTNYVHSGNLLPSQHSEQGQQSLIHNQEIQ